MDKKLKELPLEERIKLVEELWDSIAAEERMLPLTPAQSEELDRRLDAYELDRNSGRSAAIVLAEVRHRIESKAGSRDD